MGEFVPQSLYGPLPPQPRPVRIVGQFNQAEGAAWADFPRPGFLEFFAMKVVPLGDKVVIKRLDAEETTAGGIVLPDAAKEKPKQGRVLSVGDGRLLPDGSRSDNQVSEGDRVLFSSYSGMEVEVDGEDLLIMSEDEILGILK